MVTTWNAMDLLPYEHPLYVGRPGVVALRNWLGVVRWGEVTGSVG